MWKYISQVSKFIKEKTNKKALNAARDAREYEKIRTRKFSTNEKLARHEEKGMILRVV